MTRTAADAPPPASAAWRPGDPPGRRRFVELFTHEPLALEAGGQLGPITVAYESWGRPDPQRAVLLTHGVTGDSHAVGPAMPGHPMAGWWEAVIGPGRGLDTDRFWVVCANSLGGCQGTTGPASPGPGGRPWGARFPRITIRDQVAVQAALADALGVARWSAVIGPSMGAMAALEWAVDLPDRVAASIPIGCGAAASAEQIALGAIQVSAIRNDGNFNGGDYYGAPDGHGPHRGLGLARRVGHLSYRSEAEMQTRFGREPQVQEDPLAGGRYAIESYLDHHANKLARRFDANSYITLTEAMAHHDVGRGRGGVGPALAGVRAATTAVGIDSDRLYPLYQQHEIVEHVPDATLEVVRSIHGHDGFLVESEQLDKILARALEGTEAG